MENKIVEILAEVLECDVNVETSQSNCDFWDSMHHLNLIVELEDAFELQFEPEEIAEMHSVSAIKRIIESKNN